MEKILANYYESEEKVRHLISQGDLSSLGKIIDIPEGITHTFDNRVPDICCFYHRDRGEDLSIDHYDLKTKDWNPLCEYAYLFKDGIWYVRCEATKGKWKELKAILAKR